MASLALLMPTQAGDDAAVVDLDRAIVARVIGGERGAFDLIVRRHERGIWRLVRRYVREADAFDVAQQTFVRAYKAMASFRGAASVRSWLYRIAINCALSWVRDHRREEPRYVARLSEDLVGDDDTQAALDGEARRTRLRAAVAQLPPKQRLVVELRVFDDLAFKEVAELAECSENTAKVNFHHAVKRLRELLGGRDGDV